MIDPPKNVNHKINVIFKKQTLTEWILVENQLQSLPQPPPVGRNDECNEIFFFVCVYIGNT